MHKVYWFNEAKDEWVFLREFVSKEDANQYADGLRKQGVTIEIR